MMNHLYSFFFEGVAEIVFFADENSLADSLRN